MEKEVSGIILIAGSSTRYQKGINKNFELINNKPVFYYSLKVMNEIDPIKEIILVIRKDEEELVNELLKQFSLNKEIKLVYGGNTRQQSVYNALNNSINNTVIIHDGARPLIKKEYIINCLEEIDYYPGVIVGVKVKDTIKIINDKGEVESSTNRKYTYIAQTPQCFNKDILIKLHEKYQNSEDITDDAMLLEKENIKVKLVNGSYRNIKLTTSEDYYYIKRLLEGEEKDENNIMECSRTKSLFK